MMRLLGLLTVIILTVLATNAYAEGCKEQISALSKAALQEFDKAEKNYQDMMPEPKTYMSEVKKCIGSLANWTASIGFKMPSTDQLLRNLCAEAISHFNIPNFDFNFKETIGEGSTWTRYEVPKEEAEAVFHEIWNDVWK
jgi:hypothetical protein